MADMEEPLRARLAERLGTLRREYASGEHQLAALDARAAELRNTLLRISGAIQVLEEALTAIGEREHAVGAAPADRHVKDVG